MASKTKWHDPLGPQTSAAGQVLSYGSLRGHAGPVVGKGLTPLAGVVAVVGCDGTGKTTLVRDLVENLRRMGPTERRYMGLVSGETGDRIKQLPFIGIRLERHLAAKVRRAQDMEKKIPGPFTAIVMYLFSLWRVLQLRRLMRLAQRGVMVIADRYPQAEIAGFHYDGPGLTVDRTTNRLVRMLAAREKKLYEWMAEQKPSLIIRLNIDAETAHARKSDHPLSELREKAETMPRIKYNRSEICEVDARMPYPQVLETAMRAIDTKLGTSGKGGAASKLATSLGALPK